MGCFDCTCSITGIPVGYCDKVIRVYVGSTAKINTLANLRFGGEWQVLSLPIRGEYNDYGEVKNVPAGDIGQAFLEGPLMFLFRDVVPPTFSEPKGGLERFKNEGHCGHQTLPDNWTWGGKNEWNNEESCDRKFKRLKSSNGSAVGGVFVHQAIWDHICTLGPVKEVDAEIDTFLKARKERLDGREESKKAAEVAVKLRAEGKELSARDLATLDNFFEFHETMRDNQLSRAMTLSAGDSLEYGAPLMPQVAAEILNMVDAFLKTGDDYKATPIRAMLASVVELINFYHGSAIINKTLEPPVHRAGQHQQAEEALLFHDYLLKAAEVQRQKIVGQFEGDALYAYFDADDPVRKRLAELCPELDNTDEQEKLKSP